MWAWEAQDDLEAAELDCREWKLSAIYPHDRCEICHACSKPVAWKGAHWCGYGPNTCTLIKNMMMMMMMMMRNVPLMILYQNGWYCSTTLNKMATGIKNRKKIFFAKVFFSWSCTEMAITPLVRWTRWPPKLKIERKKKKLLGPVVQSIVSLTSLLRGRLVKCFMTSYPNTLIFFVEKIREAFAMQKLLTFFQQKILAYFTY